MKLKAAAPMALGLAGLVACAPSPHYPRDEYERFPSYKPEMALHEIARVFDSECGKITFFHGWESDYEANSGRLACRQEFCTKFLYHGQGRYECTQRENQELSVLWSEVLPPTIVNCNTGSPEAVCLKFTASSRLFDFHARNLEQAQGLKKAIETFLEARPR